MKDGPRSRAPRRPRPCTHCGKQTETKSGVCSHCVPRSAKRPEVKCCHCGTPTTAKAGICRDCSRTPIPDRPCADDELTGGHWLVVRGVRRYVPDGHGYDWIAQREAKAKAKAKRDRALSVERLISHWWERPPLADDPQVIARRLAEAVAEYAEHDERTTQREAS